MWRVNSRRRRRGLLNCTRQWGESTIAAAKAVREAWNQAGSLSLVVSPSTRQSGEFVRKAAGFARLLGVERKGDGDNEMSLVFPNGSRIVGLPGSEATIRGFSAVSLLVVDEAARVSDELYKAVRPMQAVSGGALWLMSTPHGKRGFFWEAWERGGAEWERVRVTAQECPRIGQEFLEEERRNLPRSLHGGAACAAGTTANVTREKRYPAATGSPIELVYTYNPSYNNILTSSTDGRGTTTLYTYGSVNGHVLYPTTITGAYRTSEARATILGYDFWTGQVSGRADVNNAVTTTISLDVFGRPTGTTESGGGKSRYTNTIYDETERSVEVRQDLDDTEFTRRRLVNVARYDPLGRVRLTQQMENGETSAGDTVGIKVQTRYGYKAGKQVVLVSNPYRAASSNNSEETMGWTKTESDPGGRVIRVEHLPAGIPQSRGATTTAYDRQEATTTDPQSKNWKQRVDSLGRLDRVTEVTGGNVVTTYAYTATDLLSSVTQGVQTRTFAYDCLGRLTSSTQPEISPDVSCVYDGNGNVTQRTDARGTVTANTYNLFNQISTKSYSAGTDTSATANVDYSYSTGGWLNSVTTTGVSTTTYGYDGLGRVTSSSQQPWGGTTRSFTYGRNWADGVTSIGYPSGLSVSYTYDGAGRVTTVTGTKGGVSTAYYQPPATSPELQYAPHGGLWDRRASTFGTETIHYNDRLQTSTIAVNRGTTPLLGLTYTYGEVSSQNNGNVMSQEIQPLGATQSYTYDGMNRLDVFTETRSGLSFTQEFGYDRYGNRWLKSMTGGIPTGVPNGEAWFSTSTNRLDLTHDADGNLRVLSPYTGRYTAEGLLGELESTGNGSAKFEYDGEGRRVKKITCGTPSNCTAGTSGAVVTEYVYDAMGNLAAEFGPINDAGTKYLFADALGSTRVTTDGSGNTVRRYDYAPFGEELTPAWTNWRTTAAGYGTVDSFPPKFTGKERDSESGLDYFGARYYDGAQGRWTSPDLVNVTDERLRNPSSTLNKYAYAANNPLKYVDPDGRDVTYFYDQGGIAGHSIVYAYNQATGDNAIEDFGPRVHAPIWLGHSMHETSTFQSPDDIRANLTALTIQTTPEVAQEVINYIRANPDPALWTAIGPNCSTAAWKVLRAAKLAHQGFFQRRANQTPKAVWQNLIRQYNPSQNGVTPQNGKDYGNPRFNMFDLLWWSLPQSEPKATVTVTSCITEPDGTTHCTTTK